MGENFLPDVPTLKPGMELKLPNEPQPDPGAIGRKLYDDLQPSVVQIVTNDGRGSGFFADKDGRVVTDAHVVLGSSEVYALTSDGTRYKARIEKLDDIKDLAVLKLDGFTPGSAKPIEFANKTPEADQPLYALGHPVGLRPMYVSPGAFQVETTTRQEVDTEAEKDDKEKLEKKMASLTPKEREDVEADLARKLLKGRVHLEPGNSGGPVVDEQGKLVGVSDMVDGKDHSKSYYNPTADVQNMLNSKSKFDFTYAYEPSRFARSYELAWQQNPGSAVMETGLFGGMGYVGYRMGARSPRFFGVAAGLYGLGHMIEDGSNFLHSTDQRDQMKLGAETISDAAMAVGGTAMLFARYRTAGMVALGLGIAGNLASSFIPNHLVLKDMKRADGDPRGPYSPDAVLSGGLSYRSGHNDLGVKTHPFLRQQIDLEL